MFAHRRLKTLVVFSFLLIGTMSGLFADNNRWSRTGPDGGDVGKLVMDPQSPQVLYALMVGGGLYKTTNGGALWTSISGILTETLEIKGLGISHQNGSLLYAGTSAGCYRSLDGGGSWERESSSLDIRSLAVSPENDQTVFAGTSAGVYKSEDAGLSWIQTLALPTVNVLKFAPGQPEKLYALGYQLGISADSGETWSTSSSWGETYPHDLAIDPGNALCLYVLNTYGLYKTTDGGIRWDKLTNYLAWSIAVNPADSSELYLGYLSSDPENFFCNTQRSSDGGQSWPLFALDRFRMLFDPTNPDVIYAVAWKKGIFKSTDGGLTWVFSSSGIGKLPAGPLLAVAPAESSSYNRTQSTAAAVYVGCPRGVLKSTDGAVSWQEGSTGVGNNNIKGVDAGNAGGNDLLAGTETFVEGMGFSPGGVFRSDDGGATWTGLNENLSSKDVRRVIRVPSAPTETLYAATAGGVFVSADGGANWTGKNSGLISQDIRDLVSDPANPQILLTATASGVFRTDNGAETWTASDLAASTRCLEAGSQNPATFFAGTVSGFFRSEDGGATWQNRSVGLGSVTVTAIAVNPGDTAKIIIGTEASGVYQSLDGAASWTPLNNGLTSLGIVDVAFAPGAPETVFASAGAGGLFAMTIVPAPIIALDKTRLDFGAGIGGPATATQFVRISNAGDAPLNWTAVASSPWIKFSPDAGIDQAELSVWVDPDGLVPGTFTETISIQDPAAVNSPLTISVTLHLYEAGTTLSPFGFFDTPTDGTTGLSGSIPVTGWALDDIEVQSVEIYRDPVGSEPAGWNGLVFIGKAIFVEGARPDVELAFPGFPLNDRAGWGYMLLTNFLPAGGNGTFTLTAVAVDQEGHQTDLGRRMISCDNANAILPFGAIDTPAQGGTASGSPYFNFGWALTPMPNSIPVDGSTITVWIDGLPLGPPSYNHYRADIATLFPGYANAGGAVGVFSLDTTVYADAKHTIAWSVEDSAGNTDGIGSRYFEIWNAGSATPSSSGGRSSIEELRGLVSDKVNPVNVRKGYRLNGPSEQVDPDREGAFRISLPELERIVVSLDPRGVGEAGLQSDAHTRPFEAYLCVGTDLRPLPLGTTFDSKHGILYWQPGPGFIGDYHFVFINGNLGTKTFVTIRIDPSKSP